MIKMKRIFAIFLAAATALSVCGCGKKEETKQNEAAKSFKYWVTMTGETSTRYKSYADMTMYKEREKQSGIHIEFVHPPAGQENEQFNLMIASRELPDMIEYNWFSYRNSKDSLIDDDVIICLDDIIDKCAPNFKKLLDENEIYRRQAVTYNHRYYEFPGLNTGNYRTFGGLMVRKDWLDELGLPIPETVSDWETMLTAFKDKKGASAPFTFNSDMFWMAPNVTNWFNGAYNVGKGLYRDGDKIKFGPLEPGYKEYISLLNDWYKKGLIDKDFSTNSANAVDANITNGDSGAFRAFIGGGLGRYLNVMKEKDPNCDIVGVPYPVLNKGDENRFVDVETDVQQYGTVITTACKDPEGAAKWLDYWYSDEGIKLCNFGVEGKTYNMKDGKAVYTDEILKNPEGLSVSGAMYMHFRPANCPGVHQLEDYLMGYYQYDQQKEALKLWSESTDAARSMDVQMLTPNPDDNEEASALDTEIRTYVEENTMKFVNGTRPIGEFDKFVDTLKKMNVERYIEIYQNAYNNYIKEK